MHKKIGIVVDLPTNVITSMLEEGMKKTKQETVKSKTEVMAEPIDEEDRLRRKVVHALALGDKTQQALLGYVEEEKIDAVFLKKSAAKLWAYNKTEKVFKLSVEAYVDKVYIGAWPWTEEEQAKVAELAISRGTSLGVKKRTLIKQKYTPYSSADPDTQELGIRMGNTSNRSSGFLAGNADYFCVFNEELTIPSASTTGSFVVRLGPKSIMDPLHLQQPGSSQLFLDANNKAIPVVSQASKVTSKSQKVEEHPKVAPKSQEEGKNASRRMHAAVMALSSSSSSVPDAVKRRRLEGGRKAAAGQPKAAQEEVTFIKPLVSTYSRTQLQSFAVKAKKATLAEAKKMKQAELIRLLSEEKEAKEDKKPEDAVNTPQKDNTTDLDTMLQNFEWDVSSCTPNEYTRLASQYDAIVSQHYLPGKKKLEEFIKSCDISVAKHAETDDSKEREVLETWYATNAPPATEAMEKHLELKTVLQAASARLTTLRRLHTM